MSAESLIYRERELKRDILEALKREIVVADGGMGSQLCAKGINPHECFDYLNITRPGLISGVHDQFLVAGARLIETNTFGANRYKLAHYGHEDKVFEINRKGAELAGTCAGENAWVAGSMGPAGRFQGSRPDEAAIVSAFKEQAEGLVQGGVDLVILETFNSLREILLALKAVRQVSSLPVVAQLIFERDGKTLEGDGIVSSFVELREKGADIVGANCGLGPKGFTDLFRDVAAALDCPVSAFPNAGIPEKVDDRLIFMSDPGYYADTAGSLAGLGVNIIGGCCGTTPEHIKALAERAKDLKPLEKRPALFDEIRRIHSVSLKGNEVKSTGKLTEKSGRKKIIVELDPPKHLDLDHVLTGAEKLKEAGVDFISIAENPLGIARLSNITLAGLIREKTGIDPIIHLTGRDRNLIGIQSTLLGLAASGHLNVLAVTGDPPLSGSGDKITGVFDVRSYELIELLNKLNQGVDFRGNDIKQQAGFSIGGALNPNTRNMDIQIRRMEKKIELGARFFQTQPVYTREKIDLVAEKTKGFDVPVYLGILPLVSSRNAEFLHNEFPGISIPEDVRRRMKASGDKGVDEGIEIASELIEYAYDKFAGFFIMPPFNKYEIPLKLLEKIKRTRQ